jgi:hypothetical protein
LSALPAVAMTRASKARASWMAVTPMPLLPPCTSSVSPAARPARMKTLDHTVKNVSGRPAASTALQPRGTGRHWATGAIARSA